MLPLMEERRDFLMIESMLTAMLGMLTLQIIGCKEEGHGWKEVECMCIVKELVNKAGDTARQFETEIKSE